MSYRSRIYFTSKQRRTLTQLYAIVVIVALQQKIILISMRYGFFIVWIKEIDFSFCSLGRTRRELRSDLSQPDIHHNSKADNLR